MVARIPRKFKKKERRRIVNERSGVTLVGKKKSPKRLKRQKRKGEKKRKSLVGGETAAA